MTELQAKAIKRIHEVFAKAQEMYGMDFIAPTITFKLKGRRGGYAMAYKNIIAINNEMLHRNGDAFIKDVPGHEAAHIIARKIYPFATNSHGVEWATVMRNVANQEPTRCHDFTVVTRNEYFCKCTDTIYVSTVTHNRILKGKNYSCKKCGTQVMWKKLYEKAAIFPSVTSINQKVAAAANH
jgi:predicted SprT family Zn-dependent metalloprotease